MVEFGNTPILTPKELKDLGYKIVIGPVSAFSLVAKQVMNSYTLLKWSLLW